ncbi:hypothetical protein BaRGS_00016977 [Batillaria attramentaria]|uniref:Sulfotransferase n=1 Tax=Batillaria attramentaria TaxID=370345 RepID=A0ABD0KXF9_9CAEN
MYIRRLFLFLTLFVLTFTIVVLLWSESLRTVWSCNPSTSTCIQPLRWSVNTSDLNIDEVHHVVFVKVHKAASTTVFNMLVRFSISRVLNVMFPLHRYILSQETAELNRIISHPPSPPFLFDILCNHVIFDKDTVGPYFPNDTKYVAILRNPWDIVYMRLNEYPVQEDDDEKPYVKARFLHVNHFDVAIYNHFLHVFQQKVNAEGPDFVDEVQTFSAIERRVSTFCKNAQSVEVLGIWATRWNDYFSISRKECETMMMSEIGLIDAAREKQRHRMLLQYPDMNNI